MEDGYDGSFIATDGDDQTVSTSWYYAATTWLRLDASYSVFRATQQDGQGRSRGSGNLQFGSKLLPRPATGSKTGFAVQYEHTFPTGSKDSLRSISDNVTLITSRHFGPVNAKLNGAVLRVNCNSDCHYGGLIALGAGWDTTEDDNLQVEVFGQNQSSSNAPPGTYVFVGGSHNFTRRFLLNGGLRTGISPDASRFGLTAGITVALGRFGRSTR
jgi:hypothetical protein